MDPAISIKNLCKTYENGVQALKNVNLEIRKGEIFALLGPNGAGKTTLIGCVCGTLNPSSGQIDVFGYDTIKDYRKARSQIGLVPQELHTEAFEKVWDTVAFSRGLFGKSANPQYLEDVLKRLSLWNKKDQQTRRLSGGMKRRQMIAKALSHEPKILFLDEPSAGVDVELRKSMWGQVESLREMGVTIILTTHYIEEAEKIADRIAIINEGEIILTEPKDVLMKKMGDRKVVIDLNTKMNQIPDSLKTYDLQLTASGESLVFNYDSCNDNFGIVDFLDSLRENAITPKDIHISQRSLEEIFVELVQRK